MNRTLLKYVGFITVFALFLFLFTSCKFQREIITFTYEELSNKLEKVALVDASGVEHGEEEKVVRVLTLDETENVLSKIGNMSFETTFYGPEPNAFMGTALVFYYPTYKLYFSKTIIMKKNLDSDSKDIVYFYDVNINKDFVEILSSLTNNKK